MHLNKVVLVGRVGERRYKLTYNEKAMPDCRFTLEVDERGLNGKVFTLYCPVEVIGKQAETAAERLEVGQEVIVEGKLAFRRRTDGKTGVEISKMLVSTWFVDLSHLPQAAEAAP